jgi:predicted transcriptional regulator
MNLVKHTIVDFNGAPIAGAKVVVCDAKGNVIHRNGAIRERFSDAEGKVIVPAEDGEYITVSKLGYSPELSSATHSSFIKIGKLTQDTAYMFSTNRTKDLIISGTLTACISFAITMALKKLFNA